MPADKCPKCKLIHPPLVDCVEAQAAAMRSLLLRVGTLDKCDCLDDNGNPTPIVWIRTATGNSAPYTLAGLIHFADCTGKFKR
jgi:hypothetical protein